MHCTSNNQVQIDLEIQSIKLQMQSYEKKLGRYIYHNKDLFQHNKLKWS